MSKATNIILELLVNELQERIPKEFHHLGGMAIEKIKSEISDVKFDVNSRLIVFKLRTDHRWSHNERKHFDQLKTRIAEHLRNKNLDAMVTDFNNNLNIPFHLSYDKNTKMFELVSKTIMRTNKFHSNDRKFKV